ncbi:MAG: hypothetical protein R6T87_00850 [Marinobacter sp.]
MPINSLLSMTTSMRLQPRLIGISEKSRNPVLDGQRNFHYNE